MNNTAFYILSFLFIVLGSFLIHKLICGNSSSAAKFSVMDGNSFKTNPVDAYSFNLGSAKLNSNDGVNASLKKVSDHLKKNTDRVLNLNGTYFSNEKKGNISFDNLGIARAEAIRALLMKGGAPEESITVSGELLNSLTTTDKSIYNPVEFVFMEKKTEPVIEETFSEERTSVLDPYVIRFATGDYSLSMSSDLQNYLDEALTYLEGNPGTQLIVTGHTDNEGNTSANKKLSLDRAAKVRRFLRNNGVASKQVVAKGKGDTEPLEDNSTEDGRRMNRRVEITIR